MEKRLIRQKSSQDIYIEREKSIKGVSFQKRIIKCTIGIEEFFSYNEQLNRFHLQIIVSVTIDLYGRKGTTCTYSKVKEKISSYRSNYKKGNNLNPKVVVKPTDHNQGQNALNPPNQPVHLPD